MHAADLKRGFVVMEDLGDTQYLSLLRTGRGVDKLYGEALTTLANIQVRGLRAAQLLRALRPRTARARAQSHARVVPRANICGSSCRPKSARC